MLFFKQSRKIEMNTLLIPVLRALLASAALVLTAAIIWALGRASLFDSFGKIIADPWGFVTLIDLYSGFLAISVIIALAEPRRAVTASVIMLTPFLGNIVPLAWLIIRLPMLIDCMTPPALSPDSH
jgi:hypothetical protein